MFSVTQRIKTITQPRDGYIKVRDLEIMEFTDRKTIYFEVSSKYKAIQGMAVDYLTRFLSGASKEKAFQIPMAGAKKLAQLGQAQKLLHGVKGLDKRSIINACKLTSYDVAYRASVQKFVPPSSIMPNDEVIHNIKICVQRSLRFFERQGSVTDSGLTFPGGYNLVVSSGDCDFLTPDTLWDLKVSRQKPNSANTLQLLMYYIMGLHSSNGQFQNVRQLGIFNPILNCAYTIEVDRIPDRVYQAVSRDVIGYRTPQEPSEWRMAFDTDPDVFREALRYAPSQFLGDTGFRPQNYPDGIHDITVDDYWSYWSCIQREGQIRPKFSFTKYVKFLKRDGFYMFISVSHSGKESVLYGGKRRRLEASAEYYYSAMGIYANAVLERFSKYWSVLYRISEAVRRIQPDMQIVRERLYGAYEKRITGLGLVPSKFEDWLQRKEDSLCLTGSVHGCIVDLDFCSHIYLNPYDGSIAPYYAISMDDKYVFPDVASLLAEHRPEMLTGYQKLFSDREPGLLPLGNAYALPAMTKEAIRSKGVPVSDTSMYRISNRLKELQMIYDYRIIGVWYDRFLDEKALLGDILDQEDEYEE